MEPEHIGICVIVLDRNKKHVLLGKRLNSYKAGMLGLPGGRLKLKEPLEVCGKRELLEETSLTSKNLKYVGIVRELQNTYNYIHFVYCCTNFKGTPNTVEPNKCAGWEWYSLDDLPENILPGHKAAIDIYLNQNISLKQLLTKD